MNISLRNAADTVYFAYRPDNTHSLLLLVLTSFYLFYLFNLLKHLTFHTLTWQLVSSLVFATFPSCHSQRTFIIFFNVYLFLRERERQSMSRGGAEKEGDRIQSRLHTVSMEPDSGLELTKPWDQESERLTYWATQVPLSFLLFKKKIFFNIYSFLRDRAQAEVGQREKERATQSPKQAPGSEPSAQSPPRGSNSQAVRSWPEPKSDAQLTEPPRRPSRRSFIFQLVDRTSTQEAGKECFHSQWPWNASLHWKWISDYLQWICASVACISPRGPGMIPWPLSSHKFTNPQMTLAFRLLPF